MAAPEPTDMYFEVLGETAFEATVNHEWEFQYGPYNVRTKLPDGRICTKVRGTLVGEPAANGFNPARHTVNTYA